jgi:hypothetical protein
MRPLRCAVPADQLPIIAVTDNDAGMLFGFEGEAFALLDAQRGALRLGHPSRGMGGAVLLGVQHVTASIIEPTKTAAASALIALP